MAGCCISPTSASRKVPTGFIPAQDKGYLLVDVRLPDSSSLERTQEVMAQIEQIARGGASGNEEHGRQGGIHGIAHTIAISGQSFVQNAIGSNYGSIYVILDEFHHRHGSDLGADAIAAKLRVGLLSRGAGGSVAVFGAPAVDGLGNAGGFKVMVRDVGDLGLDALQEAADDLAANGNEQPGLVGLYQRVPRADAADVRRRGSRALPRRWVSDSTKSS